MDDVLLLCPTDVVYCHDHRGMDWPSEEWFHDALRKRSSLIHEALVNEAMRQPGNKVLWHDHFEEMDFEFAEFEAATQLLNLRTVPPLPGDPESRRA